MRSKVGARALSPLFILISDYNIGLELRCDSKSVIAFYQYNTAINTGTLNARLAWEFAPLSFLYFVINDQSPIDNPNSTNTGAFARETQGIFKINYIHQL